MGKAIEETIKPCKTCGKKTRHIRNTQSTGFVMILVHVFLVVITAGLWLIPLIIWRILNKPIGGWICQECGE